MKWNKLGCKPDNKINDKWKGTPKVLPKSWRGIGGPARRRRVEGKASRSGSCVIDAAGDFDCHLPNYVFGRGDPGGFALRLFLLLFCFARAWMVCFVFSFLNENLRRKPVALSLFQSQEALEYNCFFPSKEAVRGGQGLRAFVLYLVLPFMELLKDIIYLFS